MFHFLILSRIRVDSIKRSWWQILLTIIALISLCFHCMFSKSFGRFWKAGCVTKSTFCDLSQLVGDPSAREKQSRRNGACEIVSRLTWSRRAGRGEGQEPGVKLGRLIHTSGITAGTEQSLHCLRQTPLHSALCRPPHTLHCSSPFPASQAFLVIGRLWNRFVKKKKEKLKRTLSKT